jgi:hypothetical protein
MQEFCQSLFEYTLYLQKKKMVVLTARGNVIRKNAAFVVTDVLMVAGTDAELQTQSLPRFGVYKNMYEMCPFIRTQLHPSYLSLGVTTRRFRRR